MEQFTFRVKSSTNCKSTIILKAKNIESAHEKLDTMGFKPIESDGKATYVSREWWNNFYEEKALKIQGQIMLDNPEDYGLI